MFRSSPRGTPSLPHCGCQSARDERNTPAVRTSAWSSLCWLLLPWGASTKSWQLYFRKSRRWRLSTGLGQPAEKGGVVESAGLRKVAALSLGHRVRDDNGRGLGSRRNHVADDSALPVLDEALRLHRRWPI